MHLAAGTAMSDLVPDQLTGGSIDANHAARQIGFAACGDEDAIAPHNGRRATSSRQGHAPGDVLSRRPMQWRCPLVANSITTSPSPARPVIRGTVRTEQ